MKKKTARLGVNLARSPLGLAQYYFGLPRDDTKLVCILYNMTLQSNVMQAGLCNAP